MKFLEKERKISKYGNSILMLKKSWSSTNLTISIYKLGTGDQKINELPKVVELVTGEHKAPDFESSVLFDVLKT